MIYVSQLLKQKVWDAYGHPIGRVEDLMVSATEKSMPPITALVIQTGKSHKEQLNYFN